MNREQRFEAALRDARDGLRKWKVTEADTARIDAVLADLAAVVGEQEAPTEPLLPRPVQDCGHVDPIDWTCAHPDAYSPECWVDEEGHTSDCPMLPAAPQVAPTEPTDGCGIHGADATYVTQMESYCTCAPQVAPEPERCPTCGSVSRRSLCYSNPLRPDPWHRPAPLVEGEQG